MKWMVYIHVPFCRHKCSYCDFVSGTNIGLRERYLQAVEREVAQMEGGRECKTLYMGGGTPSMLSVDEIVRLRSAVERRFDLDGMEEWTVECNPEDMTEEWLTLLYKAGVTRLSIGVESLDDEALRWMERRHTADEAREAVARAQRVGFRNISCDMIYGLPLAGRAERTIEGIVQMGVQHVSAYQLMMEEGSKITRKGMTGADEERAAEEYREVASLLREAGYEHYEISNWSKEGFRSVHNSGYWTGEAYVGLGPGAHSFDGESVRRWNVGNTLKYCNGAAGGEERLGAVERFNESVMLGLRRCEGVDLQMLSERFGNEWTSEFVRSVRRYEGRYVRINNVCVRLTEEGVFVSDIIMADGMRVQP